MFVTHLLAGGQNYVIDTDLAFDKAHALISPQLELEENKFGSFKFNMPYIHEQYDAIIDEDAEIEVYYASYVEGELVEENQPMFRCRLLEHTRNTRKERSLIFEGELAYLQDSVQEPATYEEISVDKYVGKLLTVHNNKMPEKKRFYKGNVTVDYDHTTDKITGIVNTGSFTTSYTNTTWDCLQSLQSSLGGFFKVRYGEDGKRYLDYLKEHTSSTTQTIQFGTNLVDYAEEWSLADFYTVIIPLGADQTISGDDGNSRNVTTTISTVNNGSPYLFAPTSVINRFGRREKAVEFKGVASPSNLKRIGQMYLSNTQFDNMVLRLTAVDMAELGADVDRLRFQENVRAIAAPYNLDKNFPISKMSIPLKDPARAVYTMTTNTKPVRSMSTAITDQKKNTENVLSGLNDKIDNKKTTDELRASGDVGIGGWIFGVPELLYYADEQKLAMLYIANTIKHAWDAMAATSLNAITYETIEVAGSETTMPTAWLNVVAKEGASSLPTNNEYKIAIDSAYNYEYRDTNMGLTGIPDESALMFGPTTMGHINFKGSTGECMALYMVIKMGAANTKIGFKRTTGSDELYFGRNSYGYLTVETGSNTAQQMAFKTEDGSVTGLSADVNNDYLVIALIDGATPTATHSDGNVTCLVGGVLGGVAGVYSVDSNWQPRVYASWNYKMNINYAQSTPSSGEENPDMDHELYLVRLVECRGTAGVINMDEVYNNTRWLVDRFITKTIRSDADPLPADERSW